jgi:hypothetical protein
MCGKEITMYNTKRKSHSILVILSLILSLVACSAVLFGLFSGRESDENETIGRFAWELGNVNDSGELVESKESIYTEGYYSVDAMEITVAKDSTITYRVVFYDENKEFVSATESLEADFDTTSIPENAKYFRVVLTPYEVDGEAVKISVFSMSKYFKQLEIKY